MIVALAGGVGGAKLAQGLAVVVDPAALSVVVNTADDFDLYGLRICPDLDTVMYTLAGIADPGQGWGVAGDTNAALAGIAAYGRDPWFKLGDRDFATHILRTEALRNGVPLSEITATLSAALGVATTILPMSDDPVATCIDTPAGRFDFQEYFVARRQRDDVLGMVFEGIDAARPGPGVVDALHGAELVVVCPSNPFVSIGPILAVPDLAEAIAAAPGPVVAVSPIVGGKAIKGPAAAMLESLGHEVSPLGVARLYAGRVDGFVLDETDADWAGAVADLGMATLVTNTVMGGREDRARLAAEVVIWANSLARSAA